MSWDPIQSVPLCVLLGCSGRPPGTRWPGRKATENTASAGLSNRPVHQGLGRQNPGWRVGVPLTPEVCVKVGECGSFPLPPKQLHSLHGPSKLACALGACSRFGSPANQPHSRGAHRHHALGCPARLTSSWPDQDSASFPKTFSAVTGAEAQKAITGWMSPSRPHLLPSNAEHPQKLLVKCSYNSRGGALRQTNPFPGPTCR